MTWLVTGGAGYIGSHVVRAFAAESIPAVVIDDLSSGHRASSTPGCRSTRAMSARRTCSIGSSPNTRSPAWSIWRASSTPASRSAGRCTPTPRTSPRMVTLLDSMAGHGVDQLRLLLQRRGVRHPGHRRGHRDRRRPGPSRPYGESKLIGEWLLRRSGPGRPGRLQHTSLRYFNVVGSGYPDLRDTSPHNLFPLIFEHLVAGKVPYINGDDYPTPDGTCVRDYVHVSDLAISHVAAAKALEAGRPLAAGLQPGQRNRAVGAPDHGRRRPGHRHRVHARDPPAAPGRSGADRGHR